MLERCDASCKLHGLADVAAPVTGGGDRVVGQFAGEIGD